MRDRIFISSDSYAEYRMETFKYLLAKGNRHVRVDVVDVIGGGESMDSFIDDLGDGWESFIDDRSILLFGEMGGSPILVTGYHEKSDSVNAYAEMGRLYSLTLNGSKEGVAALKSAIMKAFKDSGPRVEWMYSKDADTITLGVRQDRRAIPEMYPFINGLDSFYDGFMSSSSALLLLMGPPGTGKTSFIRELLFRKNLKALVSYDPTVLSKDFVFSEFMTSSSDVFIIEDADDMIRSRKDDNPLMHRFLSVGDGLVTQPNKKIILSTNLDNIRNVDQALVRRGRCFDVIHFRELRYDESVTLCAAMGVECPSDVRSRTLAEILNSEDSIADSKPMSVKVGF